LVIHPRFPDLVLVDAAEVSADHVPEQLRPYQAALRDVVAWAWNYLCRPHPELGRRGPVCPYARSALNAGAFFLAVRPGRPAGPREVAELLQLYRDWFQDLPPSTGRDAQLKTVLVLFPDLGPDDWSATIDSSQHLLKREYVRHGFMIGEFHAGPPPKGGLRNERFQPLRSPVPMLVIRHMVATDLAFLDGDHEYFHAYRSRFADQVPAGDVPRFEAAVRRFNLERAGGASR
jgi:hypothetical protein